MMNLDGHEERWQAYLIPGTDVLRNKLGIEINDELRAAEADLVEVRIAELRAAPDRIARTYDLQHLRAVHLQLFQDIYDWAGAIRTVGITKGGESFIPPGNIEQPVAHVTERIESSNFLRNLDESALSREVAYLYDYLNFAHPFREGNGRVQREFFDQLLSESGHGLAWDMVDKQTLHQACHQARAAYDITELEELFRRILDDQPAYDFSGATPLPKPPAEHTFLPDERCRKVLTPRW